MAKRPSPLHVKKLAYIAAPQIDNCIFCGAGGPLTKEHIFSRWIHRYLPASRTRSYESLRGTRHPSDSEHHIVKRAGDIRDWQVRCVCQKTCNNGWMRQLVEDRARPVLLPLIRGEEMRITPAQQESIATWATMKAMVGEWLVRGHVTTNHMQRKRMMYRQLPPKQNWGVWIGRFISDDRKPDSKRYLTKWQSNPFLLVPDSRASRRPDKVATHYNSQSSTQVIGELLIQTLRSPMPNLIPRWSFKLPDSGTLFRIWPRTQTSIVWPQQAMSDLDAYTASNAFMNFMLNIQRRDSLASPTRRQT
jgi:hypothetical protein